jgi:precorrin-2 dehydrogenase/sirohydrochlorin ferrochelatase
METFPAYFPLKHRKVVIAGDGDPAEAKARLFEGSPALVIRLDRAPALDPAAYAQADLIFIASFDKPFVLAATTAARAAGVRAPINVVDHPELSDFHTPAIIDRGQVVAAIGTAGAAPLMASLLRAEIETRIPQSAGRVAGLLALKRDALRDAFPDLPARRGFLRAMLAGPVTQAAEASDLGLAEQLMDEALAAGWSGAARISLIEAPPAADLISVRAVRALNVADILAIGEGGESVADAHGRRDAERWTMGHLNGSDLDAQIAHGRLIAVVARTMPAGLGEALEARGVMVDRLAPASAG